MAPSTKAGGKATKAPVKGAAKAASKTSGKAASPAQKATKPAARTTAKKTTAAKAATTKKAPAKKATAAKKATKQAAPNRVIPALAKRTPNESDRKPPPKRKGPLDKFLQGQLEVLQTERETYLRQAESLRAEADLLVAEREPGDVQFDEESGEGDTVAVERERDLALSAQAAAAVDEIDRAIAKIREGTYGVCEQCYSTIPKERLKALPFAALCVQCKSAGFTPRR